MTDPTKLPFHRFSLKLWRHTALQGVQLLRTYLLKGYLRMYIGITMCVIALPTVQLHCVRQRSQPPAFICTSNCRSVAGMSTCCTFSSTVSVLLHFCTVISCQCGEMAEHRNTGKSLYLISKYRMFLFPADRRVPPQRSARCSACIATGRSNSRWRQPAKRSQWQQRL